MVNLYADGEVCHYTVNSNHYKYPKFDLPYILKQLEYMLYSPDSRDPANGQPGGVLLKISRRILVVPKKAGARSSLGKGGLMIVKWCSIINY